MYDSTQKRKNKKLAVRRAANEKKKKLELELGSNLNKQSSVIYLNEFF